jgi:hypothetical protein
MSVGQPDAFGAPLTSRQWQSVCQPSARSRGSGCPVASFDTFTGDLALRGGHECDLAYFQSPLRGNYEVACRLSQFDWRESMVMAAGVANHLNWQHTTARVMHVRTKIAEVPTPQPITPQNPRGYDYKIVVRDGSTARSVKGQLIYEAKLPKHPDPWLAMIGLAGHSSRYARNIVITGNPEIPDELDLLAPPDLQGWITDYYGESLGDASFAWTCQDGVLACDQAPVPNEIPGRLKIENVIRYHRPMLEDGEISYEFYYDPDVKLLVPNAQRRVFVNGRLEVPQQELRGRTMVAPALDRLVCLLEPDGVRIHWLTDGRFERTGLRPDNAEPAPQPWGQKKLPLNERDWNAVTLSVAGDTLSIRLNGELVFEREIESTNLRQFGLFHYVNESGVRVRNVRYRGDWPKQLPPVAKQELARGPESLPGVLDGELPLSRAWNFTNSQFPPDEFAYHWEVAQVSPRIRPSPQGLRFELPAGVPKVQHAGIHPKLELSGDFSVILKYAELRTTVGGDWGAGLELRVRFHRGNSEVETGLQARDWKSGKHWRAVWHQKTPLGDFAYDDESMPGFPAAGRVRLERRGPILYSFFAEGDSDDYRLVNQRPIGTEDIEMVQVEAVAADAACGVEFCVESLKIRADRMRQK